MNSIAGANDRMYAQISFENWFAMITRTNKRVHGKPAVSLNYVKNAERHSEMGERMGSVGEWRERESRREGEMSIGI